MYNVHQSPLWRKNYKINWDYLKYFISPVILQILQTRKSFQSLILKNKIVHSNKTIYNFCGGQIFAIMFQWIGSNSDNISVIPLEWCSNQWGYLLLDPKFHTPKTTKYTLKTTKKNKKLCILCIFFCIHSGKF